MQATYMGKVIRKNREGYIVDGVTYPSLEAATTAVERS